MHFYPDYLCITSRLSFTFCLFLRYHSQLLNPWPFRAVVPAGCHSSQALCNVIQLTIALTEKTQLPLGLTMLMNEREVEDWCLIPLLYRSSVWGSSPQNGSHLWPVLLAQLNCMFPLRLIILVYSFVNLFVYFAPHANSPNRKLQKLEELLCQAR